jgi:hypothetical protein
LNPRPLFSISGHGGREGEEIAPKRWFACPEVAGDAPGFSTARVFHPARRVEKSDCPTDFDTAIGFCVRPEHIELFSPLPPAECVRRIEAVMDRDFTLAVLSGNRPVIGRITEDFLRLRKRTEKGNTAYKRIRAKLSPQGGGTLISGELGETRYARTFARLWPYLVVVFGIVQTVNLNRNSYRTIADYHHSLWITAAVHFVFLFFGLGIIRLMRHMTRDEARFLTDFLMQTIDARRADGSESIIEKTPPISRNTNTGN